MKHCLLTNDVETTSILNHKLRDKTADYILEQGMPRLLDLYDEYGIKVTFFFTGHIAKLKPELVKIAHAKGHEIGSHGLSHDVNLAFDILPLKTQIEHLVQSKKILEDICGQNIISFRAPAARVNFNLPVALEKAEYKIDSSVSSQRLDMLFSFGSIKKMNWIWSPRLPYFAARENIFKRGNSSVFEIPISAVGLPYIGTLMRISPFLTRITRWLLYFESIINHKPINFLTHPNEFIDEDLETDIIQRRSNNFVSYYLRDVLRHKLKIKNLGITALPLLREEIKFFKKNKFKFTTCKEFYSNYRKHEI